MTTDTTAAPRANRQGDPCPPWCTSDHSKLVIEDKPQFGYMDHHFSDYMTARSETAVKLHRVPGSPTFVRIDRLSPEEGVLTARQAEDLAAFLEGAPVSMTELISQLRAAAAAADAGEGK
jgi:hypothetical protein